MPAPVRRLKLMISGFPKSGKTGSIVALLDAGFEVGLLDFDGNPDPLLSFTKPEMLNNLSIVTCQDILGFGQGPTQKGKEFVQIQNEPTALRKGLLALNNWTKADPEHDWGPVRSWGTNRVLVLDSLTSMGDAAFERIRFINNRGRGTTYDSDFGAAMDDQSATLAKLMSSEYHCHVICMAHLKMIGPKLERMTKDDSADLVEIKTTLSKNNIDNIPTRLYPSALGRALPPMILRHCPASIIAEARDDKRVFITKPRADIAADIGVPGRLAKDILPIESGLLDIMEAVTGHRSPY